MNFEPTSLPDVLVVTAEMHTDERGGFVRTYCQSSFRSAGLDFSPTQGSASLNKKTGTLRGMHMQRAPHSEKKLVRCTKGKIFDVAVDVRPQSPTRGQWFGITLTEDDCKGLYIPEGFAHGFVTLVPNSIVSYLITPDYVSDAFVGFRWDDPDVGIAWPAPSPETISERDRNLPLLGDLESVD